MKRDEYRRLFAKRLRSIRKKTKLTLETAAERANLSGNYWGEVERNKKVPSLDTIVAMADALGISVESLMKAEREEDTKNLRRRVDVMLNACSREQLELMHRLMIVVLEP
jgi:transcriptional regulator with XRE-family HTH domain